MAKLRFDIYKVDEIYNYVIICVYYRINNIIVNDTQIIYISLSKTFYK